MKSFDIEIENEIDVVLIDASIKEKYKFRLALDTAATHTTIDSNMLYLSGYQLKNSKGEKEIETSNGIILVELFDIEHFECLGIKLEKFEVQVYDFVAHGITSNYDGVVGLDFLKQKKFCIDIPNKNITIDI